MQVILPPELMDAVDALCTAHGIPRVGPDSRKSRVIALLIQHALTEKPAVLAKLFKALTAHQVALKESRKKAPPHRTTAAEMLALMGPLEYGPMKK